MGAPRPLDGDVVTSITRRGQVFSPLRFGRVLLRVVAETVRQVYFVFAITQDVRRTKPKNQSEYAERNDWKLRKLRWNPTIAAWLPTLLRYLAEDNNEPTSTCSSHGSRLRAANRKNTYSKLQLSMKVPQFVGSGSNDNHSNDFRDGSGQWKGLARWVGRPSKLLLTSCPRPP